MLNPLPDEDSLRIISIDPGSNCAGFAVMDVNLVTRKYHVLYCTTIKGNHLLRKYKELKETHEVRFLRNHGYGEHFSHLLEQWKPHTLSAEASFMGRFAATYKALTEQVTFFRAAAFNWDRLKPFYLYTPPAVKRTVGVSGKSKDKDLMTKALRKRNDILYGNEIELDSLDEHSVDSICVGIHHAETLNLWTQT